jgi:OOP family OmpA-OmpF porin
MDGIDQCPGTAKGLKVDGKGCTLDSDGDGVPDTLDQCADTPKGTTVDEKGCPVDTDGDGVADYLDKCPGTPKDAVVDAEGCPPAAPIDSDGDGVIDSLDKCPNTKAGTKVDAMGCALVTKARGVLKGVNFQFGKAELTPVSLQILDDVAAALNEFPLVHVEVQGHTDATGPENVNLNLSAARAEAVATYLASKGVARERLQSKGYGSSKPIGNDKTRAGRAQNRRVELNWLDQPNTTTPETPATTN